MAMARKRGSRPVNGTLRVMIYCARCTPLVRAQLLCASRFFKVGETLRSRLVSFVARTRDCYPALTRQKLMHFAK